MTVREALVWLGVSALFFGDLYGSCVSDRHIQEEINSCQKACYLVVSKIMDEECYCKTPSGWDLQKKLTIKVEQGNK